jgi:hypothetical protein
MMAKEQDLGRLASKAAEKQRAAKRSSSKKVEAKSTGANSLNPLTNTPEGKLVLYGIYAAIFILVVATAATWFNSMSQPSLTADQLAKQQAAVQQKADAVKQASLSAAQSASQSTQLSANDTRNIVIDGMGQTGKMMVEWLDLIMLLVIGGFIIGVFVKLGAIFK